MHTAHHMPADLCPGKPLKELIVAAPSAMFGKGHLDPENVQQCASSKHGACQSELAGKHQAGKAAHHIRSYISAK